MNPLHPKKLLLSKWTAVKPTSKNKHFLVSKVIVPELPEGKNESAAFPKFVDLEAVYSKEITRINWQELQDETQWRQGWV